VGSEQTGRKERGRNKSVGEGVPEVDGFSNKKKKESDARSDKKTRGKESQRTVFYSTVGGGVSKETEPRHRGVESKRAG